MRFVAYLGPTHFHHGHQSACLFTPHVPQGRPLGVCGLPPRYPFQTRKPTVPDDKLCEHKISGATIARDGVCPGPPRGGAGRQPQESVSPQRAEGCRSQRPASGHYTKQGAEWAERCTFTVPTDLTTSVTHRRVSGRPKQCGKEKKKKEKKKTRKKTVNNYRSGQ